MSKQINITITSLNQSTYKPADICLSVTFKADVKRGSEWVRAPFFSEERRGQRGDPTSGRVSEEDMTTLPKQLENVSITPIKGNAC